MQSKYNELGRLELWKKSRMQMTSTWSDSNTHLFFGKLIINIIVPNLLYFDYIQIILGVMKHHNLPYNILVTLKKPTL